jgi:hexosaminidase
MVRLIAAMSRLAFLTLAGVLGLFPLRAEEPLPLIPQPRSLVRAEGGFTLPATVRIGAAGGLDNEAKYLGQRLKSGLGYQVARADAGEIRLSLSTDLKPESYRLHVSRQGVKIEGGDAAGVFYGVQTLLQLLPAQVYGDSGKALVRTEIPSVDIEDSPDRAWRGMMLDSARHFMPKEFVLKLIDLMAMQKMNRLHWHLVDSEGWRLEIKKYPKLHQVGQDQPAWYPGEDPTDHSIKAGFRYGTFHGGGFYTQEDVKEIVAHAAKRHITIMPEIEFPAHAMAMFTAYPEYSTTGKVPSVKSNHSPDLLNVNEKSMSFLKDILDETMSLFPGKWIHFGGDEAPKGQWKESEYVQGRIKELGLKNENELQSWLFGQMAEHVAKKGKVAVGWEEITHGFLPDKAVVMPWLSMKTAAEVANSGHPVILCPVGPLYFDSYQTTDPSDNQTLYKGPFTLKSVYEFNCDLKDVAPDKRGNVLGAQAQLWSELMIKPEHVEYQAFPRAVALAEATWTTAERKDFRDFRLRLAAHTGRLDVLKVNYRKLEPLPPVEWSSANISPKKKEIALEGVIEGPLQAGRYQATPVYQGGSFGLWFDRIEILADGKVIASDAHRGFTGANPKDAIYTLEVKNALPAGAKITLRASADSSEGVDSTGEIGFRKVP